MALHSDKHQEETGNTVSKFIKKHEGIYLLARLGKGLFRDGPGETARRYRIYRYEQRMFKDGNGNPLISYDRWRAETAEAESINTRVMAAIIAKNATAEQAGQLIKAFKLQSFSRGTMVIADMNPKDSPTYRVFSREAGRSRRIRHIWYDPQTTPAEAATGCLKAGKADIFVMMNQGCIMHPSALFMIAKAADTEHADLLYTDEEAYAEDTPETKSCYFKPSFSPDTLRAYNYVGYFFAFSKKLADKAIQNQEDWSGNIFYEMMLRLSENAEKVVRIPEILCFYRNNADDPCGHLPDAAASAEEDMAALKSHMTRTGLAGTVNKTELPGVYRIKYKIKGQPLISIIIPNMDHADDLMKCVGSIRDRSTWEKWEIIIAENNSTEPGTAELYRDLEKDSRIKVVNWRGTFNYSKICNFGVTHANGEYYLLLNNDTEVITPDWMEQMLMYAQRDDVGAVGAKLYYPDETVQHAGIIIDPFWISMHYLRYRTREDAGYANRLLTVQNLSAVTGACMMIRKDVWDSVKGLDESFEVTYNDTDLCMRIREAGYLVVWTPYAELYHYEMKSRGKDRTPEKAERAKDEAERFRARWKDIVEKGDPYYNPNLNGKNLEGYREDKEEKQ